MPHGGASSTGPVAKQAVPQASSWFISLYLIVISDEFVTSPIIYNSGDNHGPGSINVILNGGTPFWGVSAKYTKIRGPPGGPKMGPFGGPFGDPPEGGFSGAPRGAPRGTPKLAPPGDGGHLTDFVAN